MAIRSKQTTVRVVLLALAVFAYFVMYPQDLAVLLNPVEKTSYAVAPGLYALGAVALLCWTLIRIWGSRSGSQSHS